MDTTQPSFACEAKLIALLKTIAPYEQWVNPALPEPMNRWVAQADRQELMSLVAAGLWRLMCTPDGTIAPGHPFEPA